MISCTAKTMLITVMINMTMNKAPLMYWKPVFAHLGIRLPANQPLMPTMDMINGIKFVIMPFLPMVARMMMPQTMQITGAPS